MKKLKPFILASPFIATTAIVAFMPLTQSKPLPSSTTEVNEIYSNHNEVNTVKAIEINKEVSVDINYLFNILFPLLCILLVVPIVVFTFYKLKDKYKKGKVLEKEQISNYSFISSLTNEIIEEVKGVSKITDEMQKDTLQDMGPKVNPKVGDK